MPTYSVAFSSQASTGIAKDLWYILSSSLSRFKISEVYLACSTMGTTETMAVTIHTGSTIASAGGSTISTPNISERSGSTATFSGLINSSTPGSSGAGAVLLYAGSVSMYHPFIWRPYRDAQQDDRPVIGLQKRLQVRMSASLAALNLNGTLIVEEIGKLPLSADDGS